MDGSRVIIVFIFLITISWFILSEITILSYNTIKKQYNVPPGSEKSVMKSTNDTTDYSSLKNSESFCEKVRCIKRCCKDCSRTLKPFSSLFPYYITENITKEQLCPSKMEPFEIEERNASIENGYLVCGSHKEELFCIYRDDVFYVCVDDTQTDESRHILVAMFISIPCLVITLVVYLILPEKNVHRRALLHYVVSFMLACIIQVTNQLIQTAEIVLPPTICHLFGYFRIFFYIVSFFWMNVICTDMWLAFSTVRLGLKKDTETRMFIIFCLYSWGMPVLLILLVFLLNNFANVDAIYHPRLGEARCFLSRGYPTLFYFYLPMGILLTINFVLCILTAWKIKEAKKELDKQLKCTGGKKHNYEIDKQQFKLYLKLVLAMGINWSLEFISWIIIWQWKAVPSSLWYVSDFANASYGVAIFFIFVFKKNVWSQLKRRYYISRGQPHVAHNLSAQTSRVANFSSTEEVTIDGEYILTEIKNGQVKGK